MDQLLTFRERLDSIAKIKSAKAPGSEETAQAANQPPQPDEKKKKTAQSNVTEPPGNSGEQGRKRESSPSRP